MYYYSKKSNRKIVHRYNCSYYKKMNHENYGYFYTLEEAKLAGYRQCKYCVPIGRYYRKEYEQITNYAMENGLLFYLHEGTLNVQTSFSKWKIIVNGQKNNIFLYHKNTRNGVDSNSMVEGYHSQSVRRASLLEYMEYIVTHDNYRKYNPEYRKKEPKQPPKKGTKRYRAEQNKMKRRAHKESVWRVITLIENNKLNV